METVITISREYMGKRLYDVLLSMGISFFAPCGGNGTCGKCRVKLVSGRVRDAQGEWLAPDEKGEVLSCHAYIAEDCEVLIPEMSGAGLTVEASEDAEASVLGVALDIGTTTLAVALVDIGSGRVLKTASALNPQGAFGADVMSRITSAREGKLSLMQTVLIKTICALFDELLEGRESKVEALTVVGNPTMLHLFLGISPEGIGQYPFTPAFLDTIYRTGAELCLPCERVTLLPSASAFIGSDVVAGVYQLGLLKEKGVSLFLDVGTNGEIVLNKDGVLYAASCAAGPALEGARISSGMGGVSGAVSSVEKKDGVYIYTTVNGTAARGVCGAGLCDLVARLLEDGVIDEGGYLDEDFRLVGCHKTENGIAKTAPTAVTLKASDIREFQLAKAAIRAGLDTLLSVAGAQVSELSSLSLAGGLGYYLSPDSACRVGMFAPTLLPVIRAVGNTALKGAIAALCHPEALSEIKRIAKVIKTVALNEHPAFSERFMEAMLFGDL